MKEKNYDKAEQKPLRKLDEDELSGIGGGASDYSQVCGMELGNNCFFCTRSVHGQYTFGDGVTKDTLGCGLSTGKLGSIDGYVLVNQVPVPVPNQD